MRGKNTLGCVFVRKVSDSDTAGEDVAASLRFGVRLPPNPLLRIAVRNLSIILVLPHQVLLTYLQFFNQPFQCQR